MKRDGWRIGIVLLVVGLCVGAGEAARTPDGRLTIALPAGWHVARLANAVGQVQARCAAKEAYMEVNGVAKADRAERDLLAWAGRCRAMAERTSRLTDRQSDELRPVTLGGRPGYVYAVTGTLDGQRRVFVKSYVETDRQYVEVMCWTTPTREPDVDADIQYMADHVRDTVPASDLLPPP